MRNTSKIIPDLSEINESYSSIPTASGKEVQKRDRSSDHTQHNQTMLGPEA